MEERGHYRKESEGILLREGLPFVGIPLGVSILAFLFGITALAIPLAGLALFSGYFFRNPPRKAPEIQGAVVAPADGKVLEVSRGARTPLLPELAVKVSIFMSVLNVHVNRISMAGRVIDIAYRRGSFRPAFQGESSERNEQNVLIVELEEGGRMALVQVAGVLARRIVCWVRKGDWVTTGQPFGLICFGSRVDCYLPEGFEVDVRPGQRVWGGETILGYRR